MGCFSWTYPTSTATPDNPISPALEREGEGRARPEDVPPHGFLRLAAGGESALPACQPASLPSRPRTHHRPRQGFLRTAERARRPARLPSRARSSGQRPRRVTGLHRGHRSSTERPPRPLRSAPPPADGAPGLTSPGKRKRPETSRQREQTGRPKGRCVCPHAGEAVSPSLRRARGSSHLRTAPGRHRGWPDAVTARGLCCAAA